MTDILYTLLGVRRASEWSGGDWRLELQTLPGGWWGVAAIVALVVAVWGVWTLYRREGRNLGRVTRIALAGLRLGALAIVALMLTELVLVIAKKEQVPSHLLVLVDSSESMKLADPYKDDAIARRVARSIRLMTTSNEPDLAALRQAQRLELAKRALPDLLNKLSDKRQLSVYHFDAELAPLEDEQVTLADLKPDGPDTGLGEAIKQALAAHRGQPLAGVLLVTDGQSNAGLDPRETAPLAEKERIPIVSLAMGSVEGPSNARIADLEASPVVFVRDPSEVGILVESKGMKGSTATVTLEQRLTGGEWTEIGRDEMTLGEDAVVQRVPFQFTPESTGQFDLRARVIDAGVELTEEDNIDTASVKVVRQRIRVLNIAGYPGPEMQFLRNALLRDPGIEYASWLQSAEEGYEHIGHRPIRRLPNTLKELQHYDVVILFDPDMRLLGTPWSEMLVKFVGDVGGGLIYVAGEIHANQLFNPSGGALSSGTGGIDNDWLKVLPVVRDPGLYQSSAEVQLSSRETWTLELTPEGDQDSVFRFAGDPNRNREILTSLPGMYWHFPVTRAKQGATVLARHGDPRMRNTFGRHVLLATQLYGPGRSVFIGFDSTYRWRYLHEEYFDGFWARLVDRVGRSKVLGGRYPFTLATDKSAYRTGDRVIIQARLLSSAEETSGLAELRGEVQLSGGAAEGLAFEPSAADPQLLEASFTAASPGAYMVRVTPSATGEVETEMRPATLGFRVESPRQETDQPTLNRPLLEELAQRTGGRVRELDRYAELANAFSINEVERVLEYREELWDAPLMFGGLVVLLTAEWILRKKFRMA